MFPEKKELANKKNNLIIFIEIQLTMNLWA
jgi:hypothetical protein